MTFLINSMYDLLCRISIPENVHWTHYSAIWLMKLCLLLCSCTHTHTYKHNSCFAFNHMFTIDNNNLVQFGKTDTNTNRQTILWALFVCDQPSWTQMNTRRQQHCWLLRLKTAVAYNTSDNHISVASKCLLVSSPTERSQLATTSAF